MLLPLEPTACIQALLVPSSLLLLPSVLVSPRSVKGPAVKKLLTPKSTGGTRAHPEAMVEMLPSIDCRSRLSDSM